MARVVEGAQGGLLVSRLPVGPVGLVPLASVVLLSAVVGQEGVADGGRVDRVAGAVGGEEGVDGGQTTRVVDVDGRMGCSGEIHTTHSSAGVTWAVHSAGSG